MLNKIIIPKVARDNSEKCIKVKKIFEPEVFDNFNSKKPKLKITNYNETIFFDRIVPLEKDKLIQGMEKQTEYEEKPENGLAKIISHAISSKLGSNSEKSEINVNLNINHNYYNSNYNYMGDNKQDDDFFTRMFNKPTNNRETTFSVESRKTINASVMNPLSSMQSNNVYLFIPCTNCANWIPMEDIEDHSEVCVKVIEEVIQAESSPYTYKIIDFKLKKLHDHLMNLKNSNKKLNDEILQDMHYIVTLIQYISDTRDIVKIGNKSLVDLKKILINLDTISHNKKSVAVNVLIERARLLINEKISVMKEDYKKTFESREMNERKSGALIAIKHKIEETKKTKEKLDSEKEMILRKVNNFKKSPDFNSRSHIISGNIFSDSEVESENEFQLNAKKVFLSNNVITEIQSDLDNKSQMDEFSDATSMSSVTSNPMDPDDTVPEKRYLKERLGETSMDTKLKYKEFAKVMLKVKFEKIHNTHKGQQIPEKYVFKECIRKNIPQKDWSSFVEAELKQPQKYSQFVKFKNKTSIKSFATNLYMEVINEE